MNKLTQALERIPMAALPRQSRIHSLRSFSRGRCYIKRDDELGFGISGTKVRKYLSLLPAILRESIPFSFCSAMQLVKCKAICFILR
jgi:1-aminocyclopropane-1-carboxylate deaminase/D-cysteine desulfhydrase-like pyridoxal-dependent ACC family enzyme